MKKFISICLIALMMALCFTSCSGTPDPVPTEAPTSAPTEKPTSAPTEKPTEKPTDAPEDKGLTAEDYVEAYSAAAKELFPAIDTANALSYITPMSYLDPSETDDRNYYSVGAFILFLRNLYATEGYEITEDAVSFTATAKMTIQGQYGELPMDAVMQSYRTEDGILHNDVYQEESPTESYSSFHIDVDYDFDTDTLRSFELAFIVYSNGSLLQFNYYKFDGTSIKILDTSVKDDDYNSALERFEARYQSISSKVEGAKAIGDYSEQYTAAMIEQMKNAYPDIEVMSYKI